jgi:hypothetical protein
MYRTALALTITCAVILAACTTDSVMRPDVDIGSQTASTPPRFEQPLPTGAAIPDEEPQDYAMSVPEEPQYSSPTQIEPVPVEPEYSEPVQPVRPKKKGFIAAGFSRMIDPLSDSVERDGMPAEEVQCRKKLDGMGVVYRDLPTIRGNGDCGIAYPVEVTKLGGGVKLAPSATLTCDMAETLARWSKKELVPASRGRYFSGVDTIHQASSYSCRWVKGRKGGTLSEHGKGNALDIGAITLNNGKKIAVVKKGFWKFREKGLLQSVRSDGCDYFTTVLGPGYDYDHRNHFHFDIKERRNGRVSCR